MTLGSVDQPLLMRSEHNVRQAIISFMQATFPRQLVVARSQYGLNQFTLPDILKYDGYDPALADEFPCFGVFATSGREYIRTGINADGSIEYRSTQAVQMFLSVRTPLLEDGTWSYGPDDESGPKVEAVRLRGDMESLIVATFLQTPSMGTKGKVVLEETSLNVTKFEPVKPRSQGPGRWVASSIFSADFKVIESTFADPIGHVGSSDMRTGLLKP